MARRWLAGGVMALALVLATGLSLGRNSGAAPALQSELLRAGIFSGDCAALGDAAVAPLAPFTQLATDSGPGSPLTSFTEAAAPLADLVARPHAIAVTIGGDRNALLVCGEIPAGPPVTQPLAVPLAQMNDSGLTGLALLIGTAEITQISVMLTEEAFAATAPAGTAPAASPVASPVAGATDGATPDGDLATPPAGTPVPVTPDASPRSGLPDFPIMLPPLPSPSPVPPAVEEYVSAEFGYSLAIPAEWRLASPPEVAPGAEYLALTNGTSLVELLAVASDRDAPGCLDVYYGQVRELAGLTLLMPHSGPAAAATTSSPTRAIELWDVALVTPDGERQERTMYVDCQVLANGSGILLLVQQAPAAAYATEAAAREELIAGLRLP